MATGDPLFDFPAAQLVGDSDAQLVAGDGYATDEVHKGRLVKAFDATDEEAVVTPEMELPSHYGATGLVARVHFYMDTDVTNDIALDVFVEAKTPGTDTLAMKTATSWASANSGTMSLSGTTAGDPLMLSITLTNDDSAAVGDLIRFGLRRDCDSANDDAAGDLYVSNLVIEEA